MNYSFSEIEQKWQRIWNENKSYRVENDLQKPKCYVLDMFPYPSGAGLHVGHPLGYIATDIYSRFKRLNGYNVLHPMGFDAFGLPAEQYAIETGQHPAETTAKNIDRYKEQLNNIGFCYDWEREVRTSDPKYYRWTQWIFLQLFNSWYNPELDRAESIDRLIEKLGQENPKLNDTDLCWLDANIVEQQNYLMQFRLAYRAESYVNWCEALGTVLANDEVVNGVSERGGHPVERKLMSQWFLRITRFAERLLKGLDEVEFPESLKEMQRNWIGKSVGAEINFKVSSIPDQSIRVFTTRPDTVFGVSFMVLAPEHELVKELTTPDQREAVSQYVKYVSSRSERERMAETKLITGCDTGAKVIHPFTGEEIPVWISEYVLAGYGTGAIMAVPCGDERDYAFAKHFDLPIPNIFKDVDITESACTDKSKLITNSDFLNDLPATDAMSKAIEKIESMGIGIRKVNYRMRDAGFSRQRYWGEPFPIVYDDHGMAVALPEVELPLELPHLQTYSAGPQGKGPLANAEDWVKTAIGQRETDTMPGYAGSSWYYLRYMDPGNDQIFCDRKISDYWQQVDVYVGGAEHAVGHLLYSRMWCKALHDLGHIGFDEPYKKLINQGMIQGNSRLVYRIKGTNTFVSAGLKSEYETDTLYADYNFCDGYVLDLDKFKNWRSEYAQAEFILEEGQYICGGLVEKMSKRLYNVVNPDDIIKQYGADTFRMYEMFLGPIEISKPWDTQGIEGVHRFLKKCWRLYVDEEKGIKITEEAGTPNELKILHKTIKKIAHDTEEFAFNTAVSQFMITVNELTTLNCRKREILQPLLILLSPYAPHIAEELWHQLGHSGSILDAVMPALEEKYLVENSYLYPVAINGKTRTEVEFALDLSSDAIQAQILQHELVLKWMEGKPLKKFIFVKGKMINIVV
ncbi:MAG: leucine--tRNA ligase [Chitinophagaceae bacterium]|nr:leucine--tRNA ligase [Chitinophagaceae bacterium]